MFISGYNIAFIKRAARAAIGVAFLAGTIVPSYAQGVAGSGASYAGPTAVVGVRIPFGGRGTPSSQPVVGLRFGSSWQVAPGSANAQALSFIATIEAGLSFRGDPVLRLGSLDVGHDQLRAAAEGTQGQSFCGRNLAVCIIGGLAIVGGIVALATSGSDDCKPSDLYPPGEDPCRCYEADGCT